MNEAVSKNQEIEVLRGIAVLFVLFQHYLDRLPAPDGYRAIFRHAAFYGGVDLFFAISGFVITRSLLRHAAVTLDGGSAGRISPLHWRAFMVRRLFRLVPAAWFWLVMSVVLAPLLTSHSPSDVALVINGALAGAFGVANFFWRYCLFHHQIGTVCSNPDINGVLWSLATEIQFYLIFATLLLVVPLRRLALILLGFALAWSVYFTATMFSLSWVLRPQAMILGIGAACVMEGRIVPPTGFSRVFDSAAVRFVVLIAGLLGIVLPPAQVATAPLAVMAVSGGVLVLVASRRATWSRTLWGRGLAFVGGCSYSLYLCHAFVFLGLRELLTRFGPTGLADSHELLVFCLVFPVAVAGAIGLAHASHVVLERPFKRKGQQIALALLARHQDPQRVAQMTLSG
ncbi:MAG: acyltransferase [Azospirillaceae bacterium]|nr:acyltransferase [Azospirillaceae bacterium]